MPFDTKHQDSFTFATDGNGVFVTVSPAVYNVLGYQPEELIGKSFATIAARDSIGRPAAFLYEMLQGRLPLRRAKIGLACKDGQALAAEINCRPVLEGGQLHGCHGAVLAISRYMPPEAAWSREEREVELLLDLVCHDVNNLNQAQIGYLELAMRSLAPDSPARACVEKCMAVATNSSGLLRNVQKLQQISTGVRTLELVDPGIVMMEAVEQSASDNERDVKINFSTDGEYKVMANALLKDAFLNILDNAIKHSAGPLIIDVQLRKIRDEETDFCRVSIDDCGPGIPDEIKRRLFNRFERGITPASGKGLGLYLVRKLVEGYGGRVRAEDRVPGDHRRGSRFVVELPLASGS